MRATFLVIFFFFFSSPLLKRFLRKGFKTIPNLKCRRRVNGKLKSALKNLERACISGGQQSAMDSTEIGH